jgi:hypothetical protein
MMTGNAADNILIGGAGNDSFFASVGYDILDGGTGVNSANYANLGTANLVAYLDGFAGSVLKAGGASGQDTLTGIQTVTSNNGSNTFILKNGAYTVNGGTGNDTYLIDNASSVINDTAGFDVVVSTVSFNAGANFELIQLNSDNTSCTSTATSGYVIMDSRGSGTTMNGSTANNIYVTNSSSTIINDTGGTNTVISYASSFTLGANLNIGAVLANNASLTANNAGCVLQNFGTGGRLIGGTGNDLFQVSSNSTVVQDTVGGGFDVIWSVTSDYTLANNVEQLVVLQANGIGRSNANGGTLIAGQSNVTLVSGTGNDTLYGNGLDAIFKFNAGFGKDVIGGFTAHSGTTANDRIDLTAFGLTGGLSALTISAGVSGAVPTTTISINGVSSQDIVLYGVNASSLSALDFMF